MFNEDIKFQLPRHGQCSIFGIIGSILGAGAAKKGLEGAEDIYDEYGNLITAEQTEAFKKAKKRYDKGYTKSIEQYEPYRKLGLNLLDRYEQTLTPGSKWYQWRQKEGEKGVNRWLASRGLSGSGEAATEAFQRMGTQLSAEEEQNVYSRLLGGMNLGYDATGASTRLRTGKVDRLASLYGTKASNLSNLYTWLAEKKASMAQEKGNINAGLYSGIGNTIDQGIITGLTLGMGGGGATAMAGGGAGSVARSVPSSLTPNSLYNYYGR